MRSPKLLYGLYFLSLGLNRGKDFNSNKILNLHVGGYTLKYGPLHYYNLHEKLYATVCNKKFKMVLGSLSKRWFLKLLIFRLHFFMVTGSNSASKWTQE